jgi:hypothetical protein
VAPPLLLITAFREEHCLAVPVGAKEEKKGKKKVR